MKPVVLNLRFLPKALAIACTFLALPRVAYCQSPRVPAYSEDLSFRQDFDWFAVVGDTQRTSFWEFWREQNDGARAAVLQELAAENPAFVIHLGDLVFQGSSRSQWRQFDRWAAALRDRGIPMFPILGNHEFYGPDKRALQNCFARFPHLAERRWTAFRFRSVGIILLDSNFKDMEAAQRDEQRQWYRKQITEYQGDPEITLILVACHHPPYTNSTVVSDDKRVQEDFVGAFMATPKAGLFLSGHCHSYEHLVMDGKHFIVCGGGGGPRHRLRNGAADMRHVDMYKEETPRRFHFCRVWPLADGVRVQMVCLDGGLTQWSLGEEFVVL